MSGSSWFPAPCAGLLAGLCRRRQLRARPVGHVCGLVLCAVGPSTSQEEEQLHTVLYVIIDLDRDISTGRAIVKGPLLFHETLDLSTPQL